MPIFGSMCAGIERLDREKSEFTPRETLTEPGTLMGRWCSPTNESRLTVCRRYDPAKSAFDNEDEYTLLLEGATNVLRLDFTAAYEAFRVYGIDLDASGQETIVLEYGSNRGMFVYVQLLDLLVPSANGLETLFSVEMNGYICPEYSQDPLSWARQYCWKDVDQDQCLELELTLIPPEGLRKESVNTADTLLFYQNQVLIFKFQPSRLHAEIKRERLSKLDDVLAQGNAPTEGDGR